MGRILLALGLAWLSLLSARAAIVTAKSPDIGQTWTYGRLVEWSFRLDDSRQCLTLVATYTNDLLADRENPIVQDDSWFRFPAAHFDKATGNYLMSVPAGKKGKTKQIVVARRTSGFFQQITRLQPNAMVILVHSGTKLTAKLIVDTAPGAKMPRPFYEFFRPAPYTLQSLIQHGTVPVSY